MALEAIKKAEPSETTHFDPELVSLAPRLVLDESLLDSIKSSWTHWSIWSSHSRKQEVVSLNNGISFNCFKTQSDQILSLW
jgi:hypothetical protein